MSGSPFASELALDFDFAFDLELIESLAAVRTPLATSAFQLFSFVGEIEGYILVVSLVWVAFDKRLALRLAVLALAAMSLNHVLKTWIANPRPFVGDGSFAENWEVSPSKAQELAAEFSTPSGHAMAGSVFYAYLFAVSRRSWVRVAALATGVLVGLSRPYLGVHYAEDIALGWAIGIPLAIVSARYADAIAAAWGRYRLRSRAALAVAASVALWIATSPLYAGSEHGPPLPFVSYLGLLTGILVAYPLEERWVGFDPRSGSVAAKALRFAITVALVLGTLSLLDPLFARIAPDASALGSGLRYARYALAAAAGLLAGPYVFVRIGLAARISARLAA